MIRPAHEDDAEALTDLHLDVWDEAYADLMAADLLAARRERRDAKVAEWSRVLRERLSDVLVAETDHGRLVAFVSTGVRPSSGVPDLEVLALYVRAEVYGTGVGHALLVEAIRDAAAYLWVLDGNARAIAFYERQGFAFDGTAADEPEGLHRRMVRA